MTLLKIYTEDVKREKLLKLVSRYFQGFTMYKTTGYWKGLAEKSLCFEIIPESLFNYRDEVKRLCKDIKIMNSQESVMVIEVKAESQEVSFI